MKGRDKMRRGFTLVELLIVMVLIAMLLSLLVPAVLSARRAADRAICVSNLRQLHQYFLLYANSSDGWIPRAGDWSRPDLPIERAAYPIYPVVVEPKIHKVRNLDDLQKLLMERRIFRCPSEPNPDVALTYMMNSFAVTEDRFAGAYYSGLSKFDQVRFPSKVILLTEAMHAQYTIREDLPRDFDRRMWLDPRSWDIYSPSGLPNTRGCSSVGPWVAPGKHGRRAINCLYFDGSVQLVDSHSIWVQDFDDGIRHRRYVSRGHDYYYPPCGDRKRTANSDRYSRPHFEPAGSHDDAP